MYNFTEYWLMTSVENLDLTKIVCMRASTERYCVAFLATVVPALLQKDDYMRLKRDEDFSDVVSVSTEVFLYLILENNWEVWLYKFVSML